MESEKAELESRVKELSEASTANNTVINSPATQPETSKDNVTEKTGNKDFWNYPTKYNCIYNNYIKIKHN